MSKVEADFGRSAIPRSSSNGWRELWLKEDWWAVWLGLGIVVIGLALFAHGGSWRWVAVVPPRWTSFAQLGAHFADTWLRYLAQFVLWAAAFSVALGALGHKAREFLPSFVFLYVLSVAIFVFGQWDTANYYNLEPPLVALVLGLVISNVVGLPRWLDAGFRVEFYIKTGIVLLGATLPFTLIIWAGPVAILQASIVSIVDLPRDLLGRRCAWVSTAASPRRSAPAARCAASRPRSRSPARSARRRTTRRSRSRS